MEEQTNERTTEQTNNPKAICPSNFFEAGGIKMLFKVTVIIQITYNNF